MSPLGKPLRWSSRIVLCAMALQSGSASAENISTNGQFVIRRGGVVCDRRADIAKVRRTVNSLRYFGQLRALSAAWRCQVYARREKIVDLSPSDRPGRLVAVQVRTEDKRRPLGAAQGFARNRALTRHCLSRLPGRQASFRGNDPHDLRAGVSPSRVL